MKSKLVEITTLDYLMFIFKKDLELTNLIELNIC